MFKNKLIRFVFGFLLVFGLFFSFFMAPDSAYASDKKSVETSFETNPAKPKGQDNWYTSVTLIELDSNSNGTTYFQWNNTAGEWRKYAKPFRAWQGENTLYYYSVSRGGIKEEIKSKIIKVDYLKPVILDIKTNSEKGSQTLVINSNQKPAKYLIYKNIDNKYKIIDTILSDSYIDQDVKIGQTYVYGVVAVDQAGLKSKMFQAIATNIKPSVVVVLEPIKKEIKPQIAQGASTVSNLSQKKVEEKKIEEPKKEEVVEIKTENQSVKSVKNWNRLFVAIGILIIAIGTAIGGYYGYEWWAKRVEVKDKPKEKEKKSSNRW